MPLFHMILPSAVHTAVIGPVRGEPQLVRVVRRDGVDGEIDVVHLAGEQDAAGCRGTSRGVVMLGGQAAGRAILEPENARAASVLAPHTVDYQMEPAAVAPHAHHGRLARAALLEPGADAEHDPLAV